MILSEFTGNRLKTMWKVLVKNTRIKTTNPMLYIRVFSSIFIKYDTSCVHHVYISSEINKYRCKYNTILIPACLQQREHFYHQFYKTNTGILCCLFYVKQTQIYYSISYKNLVIIFTFQNIVNMYAYAKECSRNVLTLLKVKMENNICRLYD